MEKINIHNYEAYLLDFSDGTLSAEQQIELELFLIQHPELDIDLAELSPVSLEKNVIQYSEKNNLKRSETDLVSETQFIAYIEKQLPLQECLHLEKSCALNPSILKELNLYKATITTPDTFIVYSEKKVLKRNTKFVWFDFSFVQYAAAACVLFLIGLLVLWPGNDKQNQNLQMADKSDINSELKTTANSTTLNQTQIALKSSSQKESGLKEKRKITTMIVNHQKEKLTTEDTTNQETIKQEHVIELKSNEPLISSVSPVASPSTNTIVQVITEDEEDAVSKTNSKKKGLWELASRALKKLNQAGVKSVNSNENTISEKSGYALTLGSLNITHKPANL